MAEWNPELYLRYRDERTRPARDLVARLADIAPKCILDVGCGPGNSTALLAARWPEAETTGLDNSPAMLAQARRDHPKLRWLERDAGADLSDLGRFDLVFSNAALQWVPDHDSLLPRLFALLAPGGVLAVQVPNNGQSPMHQAVRKVASRTEWRDRFSFPFRSLYQPAEAYYRILSPLDRDFELWETLYYHVMESHAGILEWYRGSFLRPYLDALADAGDRAAFERDILRLIENGYARQDDGRLLFPFRRLFFTARKK